MSRFRAGTFEREEMPAALRHFSQLASINKFEDVDLEAFKETGKKLLAKKAKRKAEEHPEAA